MKRLLFAIWILFIPFGLFAQEGVNFEQLTFTQALEKAKQEKKLVFVDCYTSWCGPCKYMVENVFTLPEAGEFFNQNFVCVKYDMEKGEGKELAQRWAVKAYPTFFVLRPNGEVQHRILGGGTLEMFLPKVKRGLDRKTSLGYLQERYTKGKLTKEQAMDYLVALDDANDYETAQKVRQYVESKLRDKDRVQKDFWPLLADKAYTDEEDFHFILANVETLRENVGKDIIDEYLYKTFFLPINQCRSTRGQEAAERLTKIQRELTQLDFPRKEELMIHWELADAAVDGDVDRAIDCVEKLSPGLKERNDVWGVLGSLYGWVPERATKEQLKRIAEVVRKLAEIQSDETLKRELYREAEQFKVSSHVGIYFYDLPIEEAKEKAKVLGKRLFIDCYTGWCGPCMYMANVIFKDEELGDFMNQNFVCVKYDMETEKGRLIQKEYGVRAYPTFIMLNSDGSLRHQFVGGGDAKAFIARVKEGLDDSKAFSKLREKYESGCRDREFLQQYLQSLLGLYSSDAVEVANEFFDCLTDEERVLPDYWFFVGDLNVASAKITDYILKNRSRFNQSIGKDKVDSRLLNAYMKEVMQVLMTRGREVQQIQVDFAKTSQQVSRLKLKDNAVYQGYIEIAKAKKSGDVDKLINTCERVYSPKMNKRIIYNMGGVGSNATAEQQKRWSAFIERVSADSK